MSVLHSVQGIGIKEIINNQAAHNLRSCPNLAHGLANGILTVLPINFTRQLVIK